MKWLHSPFNEKEHIDSDTLSIKDTSPFSVSYNVNLSSRVRKADLFKYFKGNVLYYYYCYYHLYSRP